MSYERKLTHYNTPNISETFVSRTIFSFPKSLEMGKLSTTEQFHGHREIQLTLFSSSYPVTNSMIFIILPTLYKILHIEVIISSEETKII